jgi:hypothetical protein
MKVSRKQSAAGTRQQPTQKRTNSEHGNLPQASREVTLTAVEDIETLAPDRSRLDEFQSEIEEARKSVESSSTEMNRPAMFRLWE